MKLIFVMSAFILLSACYVVSPRHDSGPGNSENAPGHNKHCGEGPGNSGNAPGHNKDCY